MDERVQRRRSSSPASCAHVQRGRIAWAYSVGIEKEVTDDRTGLEGLDQSRQCGRL
jgi:hypothetical protein